PERPIPSGRISPNGALAVASGLTAAGVGLAAAGGGRDALRVAVPLAAIVWAYDTVLKSTVLGPVAMAGCRTVDGLVGAGAAGTRAALPSALAVGGHTLGVTALSRGEVHGASATTAGAALAGTAGAGFAAVSGAARSWRHRVGSVALSGLYTRFVGGAQ